MIPTPIQQVLSTIRKHQVQALLMGGQACVLYGAVQFSKDVDFVLLASEENFGRLHNALTELNAVRIAVPPFDPAVLARGHAVHFRCRGGIAVGLRVDLMTRLRGVRSFDQLWSHRATITDQYGNEIDLLAINDLVQAKKTQRDKDWPIIGALVEGHYLSYAGEPTPERIQFWLGEARTAERLINLAHRFPTEAARARLQRGLLNLAILAQEEPLREARDAEERAEKARDRDFWMPLKLELEEFRRAERRLQ